MFKAFLKKFALFFVFVIFSALQSVCYADSSYDFNIFVADNADILSPKTEQYINGFLWDLQKKTGTDIAVVTVKSLDGRSIEETALEIGRNFKPGEKGKDTGAVILVSPNDRKLRIEIGYGLEGIITDGHAGRIRDEQMIPYFQKGDYENGIRLGSYTLANDIAKAHGVSLSTGGPVPQSAQNNLSDEWFFILFIVIFLCIRFNLFPVFSAYILFKRFLNSNISLTIANPSNG